MDFNKYYFTEMPHVPELNFDYEMEKPNWNKKLIDKLNSLDDKNKEKLLHPLTKMYKILFYKRFNELSDKDKKELMDNLGEDFTDFMGLHDVENGLRLIKVAKKYNAPFKGYWSSEDINKPGIWIFLDKNKSTIAARTEDELIQKLS